MQKETLKLSIILTSHAKQFYHLKPHRGHTGKNVDPRCGCGEITAGKILPAVGTCKEHRVGLRWAKNPSPPGWGDGEKPLQLYCILLHLHDILRFFNNCLIKFTLIQNERKYKVCYLFTTSYTNGFRYLNSG